MLVGIVDDTGQAEVCPVSLLPANQLTGEQPESRWRSSGPGRKSLYSRQLKSMFIGREYWINV